MAREYLIRLEGGNWVAQGVDKDGNIKTLSWTSPDGAVGQLHEKLEEELRTADKVTPEYVLPIDWDFGQAMRIWLLGLASAEYEPFRWDDPTLPEPPFLTVKGRQAADFERNRKHLLDEWRALFGHPKNNPEHPSYGQSDFLDILWSAPRYAESRVRAHEYDIPLRDYELRSAEVWLRGKLCAMKRGTYKGLPSTIPWTPGRYAWDRV